MKKPRTHFKPVVGNRVVVFTEKNTQPIVKEFGFPPAYPLADHLDEAANWYLGWAQAEQEGCTGKPVGAEVAALLQEGSEKAKALYDWLDSLGFARGHLLDCYPRFDLEDLKQRVYLLYGFADMAAQRVPPVKRTADANFQRLLCDLIRIYREGTGRHDGVAWNDYQGAYTGRLLEFVQTCLTTMRVKKTDSAVAQSLKASTA